MTDYVNAHEWAKFVIIGLMFILGGVGMILRERFIDPIMYNKKLDPNSVFARFNKGMGKVIIGVGLIAIIVGMIKAISQ